jgi:hypothetical protein
MYRQNVKELVVDCLSTGRIRFFIFYSSAYKLNLLRWCDRDNNEAIQAHPVDTFPNKPSTRPRSCTTFQDFGT